MGKWITGAAVALVLGGMWFASMQHGAGGDVRARLQQFVAAADARAAAADHRHQAPWGATNAGSAFAHYDTAVAEARALGLLGFEWHVPHERGRERNGAIVTPDRLAELRHGWKPVVAELQHGAHAHDRRRSRGAVNHHVLVDVAQAEVDARWREGHQHEAVGLWLELLTVCVDAQWTAGGGAVAESIAFWRDARLAELSRADREQLATALARLDPRLAVQPDPRAIVASNVHLRDLLQGSFPPASLRRRVRAWQFGFDPAAREMAALWELAERTAVFDTPTTDGGANRAQWQALLAPCRSTTTVQTEHIVSWLGHTVDCQRRDLTELRLLRLALAFRCDESPPELADPFADVSLTVAVDADEAVFASASGQSRKTARGRR